MTPRRFQDIFSLTASESGEEFGPRDCSRISGQLTQPVDARTVFHARHWTPEVRPPKRATVLASYHPGCGARKSYGSELVRISIIQSCYIPWKGFFDLIGQCDEYVIYDSAQYVKRHWHNRNRIKTATGVQWLTIPVLTGGRFEQSIETVEIEKPWADKHWRTLELAYKGAPFFEQVAPTVKGWYERAENQKRLTDVNAIFTEGIVKFLGLKTRITRDTAYPAKGAKTERLLGIARAAGADCYLSGPSARAYFDPDMFAAAGITPEWMSYEGYPEYPQLHGPFEHAVTTLDVLFNAAPDAPRLIQRVNERKQPGHN